MTTPATQVSDETSPEARRSRILLLMLCLGALVLRLLVVWACAGAGLFSDMQEYYDRARHLVEQGQFYPDAFRPPAYPVFLAGIVTLFGDDTLIAARVIQAVLGAASVGLTGLLAGQWAGGRAGLAAAAVVAVYPAWLIYPVYLIAEPLFTFLTLLGIWLWIRNGPWSAMLAGVVLSIAMLTRAVGVATAAGISVATVMLIARPLLLGVGMPGNGSAWRPSASRLALFLAMFALALAPWVVRNARLFGEFIPTDTASGWNFILGNNPLATGRLELDQIPIVSQTYWSQATTDVERHKIGLAAGMAFMRAHPGRWLGLALRKAGYLVGLEGREHAWTYSYHYHGRRSPVVVWAWGLALLLSFPLVMIAAVVGIFRTGLGGTPLGTTLIAILLFVVLVHIGSFGESRFHVPWIPVLAIFAGAAWTARERTRASRRARLACDALLLALVVLWITQAPDLLAKLAILARSAGPVGLPY